MKFQTYLTQYTTAPNALSDLKSRLKNLIRGKKSKKPEAGKPAEGAKPAEPTPTNGAAPTETTTATEATPATTGKPHLLNASVYFMLTIELQQKRNLPNPPFLLLLWLSQPRQRMPVRNHPFKCHDEIETDDRISDFRCSGSPQSRGTCQGRGACEG
jgi:hypothetical protein